MAMSDTLRDAYVAFRTEGDVVQRTFLVRGPKSRRAHQVRPGHADNKTWIGQMIFVGKRNEYRDLTYCDQGITDDWTEAPDDMARCVRCIEREFSDDE